MSGSQPAGGTDPSMDDILASIRRILNEEEPAPPLPPRPAASPDVFALDASMLVPEPPVVEPVKAAEPSPIAAPRLEPPPLRPPEPLTAAGRSEVPSQASSGPAPLVAPEAAAAAALSVGSLRRTLEAGRSSLAVRTGGPTLDDIVREELRPILKAWLDANLLPIVERAVRTEIERVVGRADL